MDEIELFQLKILPEHGLPEQVEGFSTGGLLRLRAVAPKGTVGSETVEGWLDLKLSMQMAWFSTDAADEHDERVARGCALPVNIAAVCFIVAMVALMLFDDWCDGLLEPDDPACYDITIWSFPLFTIPLGIAAAGLVWALIKLIRHSVGESGGPEAVVELPEELWTLLGSFDEAIEHAKSGGKAPLSERAIGMGAGAIAGKIGDIISGPMISATLKMLTRESVGDKQSRIAEAMEFVRGKMVEAMLAYCQKA